MDWLLLGCGVCIPLNNLAMALVNGHSRDKDWVGWTVLDLDMSFARRGAQVAFELL